MPTLRSLERPRPAGALLGAGDLRGRSHLGRGRYGPGSEKRIPQRLLPARDPARCPRQQYRRSTGVLRERVHACCQRCNPFAGTERGDGHRLRLHGHRPDHDAELRLGTDVRAALRRSLEHSGRAAGFAVGAQHRSFPNATETLAVEDRIASAIQASAFATSGLPTNRCRLRHVRHDSGLHRDERGGSATASVT